MSKSTGEIYLQDGFGTQKYTTYLNRTLKILKRDNLQIEFSGKISLQQAMVWVKPEGNFNDPTQFNRTTDCAYFASNPRDDITLCHSNTYSDMDRIDLVNQTKNYLFLNFHPVLCRF